MSRLPTPEQGMRPDGPRPRRPARVLLVITDSNIGGTEKVVSFVARNLDRERHLPVVCSVKPAGAMAREVGDAGVEVFSLGFDPGRLGAARSLLLVPALAREIARRRIDLVHSFLFLANQVGRFAARLTGRPNISSIRVEEREKGYHLLLERLTRGLTDAYLVPSRSVASFAAARAGIPETKITVIPNPVTFEPPGEAILRPLVGAGRRFLAGAVGRLHRQKGIDVLLDAWSLIPPGRRPLLAVVGDGPDRGELEAKARTLGLGDSVRFTGWLPVASRVLPELDLLILPSRWEGLPNTVLEAMAAGVPVAASAVGGVPELIEDGRTGLLVPPGDARSLAAAVERVLAGPRESREMAARATALAREGHRPDLVLGLFQDLYDRILRERAAMP